MTDAPNLFGGTPLADRIAKAKDHMAGYRQHNETLWPNQSFALTVGELLDAAERGIKAAAEIERLRADLAQAMAERGRALTVADALEQQAERDEVQHPALSALAIVRQYPDFDAGGPLAEMMDEVLAGKPARLLASVEALAAGRKPAV